MSKVTVKDLQAQLDTSTNLLQEARKGLIKISNIKADKHVSQQAPGKQTALLKSFVEVQAVAEKTLEKIY